MHVLTLALKGAPFLTLANCPFLGLKAIRLLGPPKLGFCKPEFLALGLSCLLGGGIQFSLADSEAGWFRSCAAFFIEVSRLKGIGSLFSCVYECDSM